MIKMSIKGLADYMTAEASRQRTILRQYKYPVEDDARAKIIYYREARDRIAAHHRGGQGVAALRARAAELQELANLSGGQTKARLNHNVRAIRAYIEHFAERDFEILNDLNLNLRYGDVSVNVHPDLHVREGNKEKIIKLEFGIEPPTPRVVKIISQMMFESAQLANLPVTSSGTLYLDVPRGVEHRGARLGARMRNDIEATCENISAIWERV